MTRSDSNTEPATCSQGYVLRFRCLLRDGRALVFACDALGRIDLDRLSDRARNHYLYARALVGRDFAPPAVMPAHMAQA